MGREVQGKLRLAPREERPKPPVSISDVNLRRTPRRQRVGFKAAPPAPADLAPIVVPAEP